MNDEHGHTSGDLLIQNIVSMAREVFRANDILARYGGRNLWPCDSTAIWRMRECPLNVSEKIGKTPIAVEKDSIFVTTNFGVSACRPEGGEIYLLGGLVRDADRALYEAKRSGRKGSTGTLLIRGGKRCQ